jgi:hypothetical protein
MTRNVSVGNYRVGWKIYIYIYIYISRSQLSDEF